MTPISPGGRGLAVASSLFVHSVVAKVTAFGPISDPLAGGAEMATTGGDGTSGGLRSAKRGSRGSWPWSAFSTGCGSPAR